MLIELGIRRNFKHRTIICNRCQVLTFTELSSHSQNLTSLYLIRHSFHLSSFLQVDGRFRHYLFLYMIVSFLLINEALQWLIFCLFTGLIWLKRFHNFRCACHRFMEVLPYSLRFVHKRVLWADLHAWHHSLPLKYLPVFLSQLEQFVTFLLLRWLLTF